MDQTLNELFTPFGTQTQINFGKTPSKLRHSTSSICHQINFEIRLVLPLFLHMLAFTTQFISCLKISHNSYFVCGTLFSRADGNGTKKFWYVSCPSTENILKSLKKFVILGQPFLWLL